VTYDVAIVGGGPAGMSAALVLGRCCRRVLLCDAGEPRNQWSSAVNGYLTRDGTPPAELRRIGRAELARFETIELRDLQVLDAARRGDHFELSLADQTQAEARKLLLATGVVDDLPRIPGLAALWGRGVFPCPYCDAWHYRGRHLGVLGRGEGAVALCRALTSWTSALSIFSNGPAGIAPADEAALRARGIALVPEPVIGLEGDDQGLRRVLLEGRGPVACDGLFVSAGQHQRSPLVQKLGCRPSPKGTVPAGRHGVTDVEGLYLAGDAAEEVQFAIVAAAEGALVAFEINRALARERFSG
jgi:thioredoxin reductase